MKGVDHEVDQYLQRVVTIGHEAKVGCEVGLDLHTMPFDGGKVNASGVIEQFSGHQFLLDPGLRARLCWAETTSLICSISGIQDEHFLLDENVLVGEILVDIAEKPRKQFRFGVVVVK